MMVFIATLTTEHFEFTALGETEKEANGAIRYGFLTHAGHVGISSDWWRDYEDGIVVMEIEPGQCLRDYSPISNTRSMG